MLPKTVCFKYEHCLENNPQALKTCRAMLRYNFRVYLSTNLPKEEFCDKIYDFASNNGIDYNNIIFMSPKMKAQEIVTEHKLNWYFTGDEFEVNEMNHGMVTPIACHMSNK